MFLFLKIFALIFLLSNVSYGFDEEKCNVTQAKICVDFGKRSIDGIETRDECWKYEEKFTCISKEQNHCKIFENNRGCDESSTTCHEMGILGICKNLEKIFICGKLISESDSQDKEIKHLDTSYLIKRDEKDLSSCKKEELDKYCTLEDETCIENAETRNINGKDVYKSCWKWDRKYSCSSDTFIDECKQLPENCKPTGEAKCLHEIKIDGVARCDHYEQMYNCLDTKTVKKECLMREFCYAGICDKAPRSQHNDFGSSISYMNILAKMKSNELEGCRCPDNKENCEPGEIDPASCKFFTGNGKKCHKSTAQQNCCSDKGFLRDLFKCSPEEKDLSGLRKSGLCHHVGTWRGKDIADRLTFTSYQSHCCFKSKLAKILQVQGRRQLGISFGDPENPDCRSLTLEEIRKIDFSKLDFNELYADVMTKALEGVNDIKNKMKTNVNNKAVTDNINKKISEFYKDKK